MKWELKKQFLIFFKILKKYFMKLCLAKNLEKEVGSRIYFNLNTSISPSVGVIRKLVFANEFPA